MNRFNPLSLALIPAAGLALGLAGCWSSDSGRVAAPEEEKPAQAAFIDPGDLPWFPIGTTNISFQQPQAIAVLPGHGDGTTQRVEPFPGYVQSLGSQRYFRVFLSQNPQKGILPNDSSDFSITWNGGCTRPDGKRGYRYLGACRAVDNTVDRHQLAALGTEYLAGYAFNAVNARVNFDLLRIRVEGTVPVIVHYKKSDNTWGFYIAAVGYHEIPGARNIKEFHLRAFSGRHNDYYSVDDILVRPLP